MNKQPLNSIPIISPTSQPNTFSQQLNQNLNTPVVAHGYSTRGVSLGNKIDHTYLLTDPFMEPTYEEREADPTLYCICRGRDDGSFMLCCDGCEDWFHGICVGVAEKESGFVDAFFCPKCEAAGKGETKRKTLGNKRLLDGEISPVPSKKTKMSPEELERYKKEKAEKQRILDEDLKKKREIAQLKRQREEAERLKLKFEQERQTKEAIKKKRENFFELFRKALSDGFQVDIDNDNILPELKEKLKDENNNLVVARKIEEALFKLYHNELNQDHSKAFRALIYNLKDKKNASLRKRILEGELTVEKLVRLDPQDLANQEITKLREEQDKAALQSVYKAQELVEEINKGMKVEIEVEDHPMPSRSHVPVTSSKDNERGTLSNSGTVISNNVVSLSSSGSNIVNNANNEVNSSPIKTETTSSVLQSTLRLSGSGSFDIEKKEVNENMPRESPKQPEPSLRVDLSDVQINFSLDNIDTKLDFNSSIIGMEDDDDNSINSPVRNESTTSPKKKESQIWEGYLEYKYKEIDIRFPLKSVHINGPSIEEYLPSELVVPHRMSRDSLLHYLPKIDFSTTRNRTCVYFEVESQYDKKYKQLFDHLRLINRAGVITLENNKQPITFGVNHSFFKELYLFPLAASDRNPSFISDDEYDKDLEDMLIGVYLTDKEIEPYMGNDDVTSNSPTKTDFNISAIPLLNTLTGLVTSQNNPTMPNINQHGSNFSGVGSLLAELAGTTNSAVFDQQQQQLILQQQLIQQQLLQQLQQAQQFDNNSNTNFSSNNNNSYNNSNNNSYNDNNNNNYNSNNNYNNNNNNYNNNNNNNYSNNSNNNNYNSNNRNNNNDNYNNNSNYNNNDNYNYNNNGNNNFNNQNNNSNYNDNYDRGRRDNRDNSGNNNNNNNRRNNTRGGGGGGGRSGGGGGGGGGRGGWNNNR